MVPESGCLWQHGGVIVVVPHDPSWAATFEVLRSQYEAALDGVPIIAIEHVGSTSVPGLAAKPVIDVDIVVARADVAAAIAAMERNGFALLGDLGIADRSALWAPERLPRTNTYVVVDGSLALRNHLAVRDVLRSDAELRAEYAAIKRSLAAGVDDIDVYVAGKSDVLSRVLRHAGLTDAEVREIEAANRVPGPRAR